ncbi:trafficking protein particle complex subunit 5-like [Salvia hispanica]|uniref:trafficking protein particle complex subunit 5-like n=1 Tax=Salvia hispanica TaxID=49212 RepID=UPI0020090E02|nr:trafficking protein particle complex subunit 5-like [Salvia hispanica]
MPGKLKSKWIGPYTIVGIRTNGAVEIQGSAPNFVPFLVNGHRVKVYRDNSELTEVTIDSTSKLNEDLLQVSLSAFAFLFSELVQYNQIQVDNIAELERRLEDAGYAVGARVLELLCHREKGNRRETRLLGILSFIHSTVWKVLFGKVADSLEKGTEHEDEYMISEKELLVNRFISIPKDMGAFNCGAFVAGIVRGVLDNAGFPAVVTAHFVPVDGHHRPRTTILIKFAEEVLQREARLG